jgi:hypothetical protein
MSIATVELSVYPSLGIHNFFFPYELFLLKSSLKSKLLSSLNNPLKLLVPNSNELSATKTFNFSPSEFAALITSCKFERKLRNKLPPISISTIVHWNLHVII